MLLNQLSINKSDNLGARYLLIEVLFIEKNYKEIEILVNMYSKELDPIFTYNKALALHKLQRKKEAKRAIDVAIYQSPLIAALLKNDIIHQDESENGTPENIAIGSHGEAKAYEKIFRRFWGEEAINAIIKS